MRGRARALKINTGEVVRGQKRRTASAARLAEAACQVRSLPSVLPPALHASSVHFLAFFLRVCVRLYVCVLLRVSALNRTPWSCGVKCLETRLAFCHTRGVCRFRCALLAGATAPPCRASTPALPDPFPCARPQEAKHGSRGQASFF